VPNGRRSITLKLKDTGFRLRTRTRSGLAPTQLGRAPLRRRPPAASAECDGTAFRLIGVGASDLTPAAEADKGDLADPDTVRDAKREAAIDRLREKFGQSAVRRGLALRGPQR
jgi:DNA polymerase-4